MTYGIFKLTYKATNFETAFKTEQEALYSKVEEKFFNGFGELDQCTYVEGLKNVDANKIYDDIKIARNARWEAKKATMAEDIANENVCTKYIVHECNSDGSWKLTSKDLYFIEKRLPKEAKIVAHGGNAQ